MFSIIYMTIYVCATGRRVQATTSFSGRTQGFTVNVNDSIDPFPLSLRASPRGCPDVVRGQLEGFQEPFDSRLYLAAVDHQAVITLIRTPLAGVVEILQQIARTRRRNFEAVSCTGQVVALFVRLFGDDGRRSDNRDT